MTIDTDQLRRLADRVASASLFNTQQALRQAADEIDRLRLALEIIASDPWPCINAIQATAKRVLDGGGP